MRLEAIEDAYLELLQAQLPGALTAEEAYWAATKPLTLTAIAEWHTGNIPLDVFFSIVERPPAVTVQAISAAPAEPMTRTAQLVITVYTLGATPAIANMQTHRYANAIRAVLRAWGPEEVIEGGRPAEELAQTMDIARASFLKYAQVSTLVRINEEP